MMTTKPLLSLVQTSHGIELWLASASLGDTFAVKTERGKARLVSSLSSAKALFDDLVRQRQAANAH